MAPVDMKAFWEMVTLLGLIALWSVVAAVFVFVLLAAAQAPKIRCGWHCPACQHFNKQHEAVFYGQTVLCSQCGEASEVVSR